MGDLPTTGLSAETRELLTVIRQALDLPYGATPDDHDRRLEIRQDNATRVACTLAYMLDSPHSDIAIAIKVLREGIAENPVTYATKDGEAGR